MKTVSEQAFESFLFAHGLQFEKIREEDSRRPDYKVHAGNDVDLFFEVKELSEDQNFKTGHLEVSSRTVGDHIRKKIQKARQQIQYGAQLGIPSILLIYNDIDPMHLFGTEDHDFIAAMYGAYTVRLNAKTGKVENVFHGRNRSFAEEGKNTSFSALGRLAPNRHQLTVTLFENAFSKVKIPYDRLAPCFEVVPIKILRSAQ